MAVIGTQLTSYNMRSPIHGGKLRAREIRKVFELALGGEFKEQNIFTNHDFQKSNFQNYGNLLFLDDLKVADNLAGHFDIASSTEYVLVEQPWAWPAVTKAKRKNQNLVSIYSSHNIESVLKDSILDPSDSMNRYLAVKRIHELELSAAIECDLLVTCSHSDSEWFISEGVSPEKILYIPNCTSWNRYEEIGVAPTSEDTYFTLVGSAYPPTIDSFLQIFWEAEIWLPPDVEIRVIGGVAESLSKFIRSSRATPLRGAINLIGVLDERSLFNQLQHSSGYILPVKYGGGTNLKTAEALYFGGVTIGTKAAYRGFESYLSDPQNYVIENDYDAMTAIWKAYGQKPFSKQREYRQELTWDYWASDATGRIRETLCK